MKRFVPTICAMALTLSLTSNAVAGNIGGMRTNAAGNIGGLRTSASGNIGGMRTNAAGNIGGMRTGSPTELTSNSPRSALGIDVFEIVRILLESASLF